MRGRVCENNKKDIPSKKVEYSLISIFSKKLRVGVIGAGNAGFIKAKHFVNQGCQVEVLAKEYIKDFDSLIGDNIKFHKKDYEKSFITDKHLIIIAIEDKNKRDEIKVDCEKEFKIYIDSSSFLEGMGSIPVQRDLDNIVIGVNTRGGNPKGAVFLGDKAYEELKNYDKYIEFTTLARNYVKDKSYKEDVISFITTEDFHFFYEKGCGKEVLDMFFKEK